MNHKHRYRLTLENEATLEKKFNVSANIYVYIASITALFIIAVLIVTCFLVFTPLRKYLPGHLNETERVATEHQHLRLDSLLHIYEMNEVYLTGIFNALNPPQIDSAALAKNTATFPLSIDSLIPISQEEKTFLETIRERDKYNITVESPADAETLLFNNINQSAVISESSKSSFKAEFILPKGAPITSITDGKVISIASSPKNAGAYEIILQHPKGFLSKISKLSRPLVNAGNRVTGGEIIGYTSSSSGGKANIITVELWHDGTPLIPARYINSETKQ